MKSFITICIAVSLFGPTVAKWITYADCMYKAQNSLAICDCAKIVRPSNILAEEKTTIIKGLSLSGDWTLFMIASATIDCIIDQYHKVYSHYTSTIPTIWLKSLFHPPAVND